MSRSKLMTAGLLIVFLISIAAPRTYGNETKSSSHGTGTKSTTHKTETKSTTHSTPAKTSAHSTNSTSSAHATPAKATAGKSESHSAPTAVEALDRLGEGNDRFIAGKSTFPNLKQFRIKETAEGQHPFVTFLSCSDSRIPVEEVFDCGVGDVFVVRVAGNVSGVSEIASIEYATEHLHTPLLVVMGHTKCGAVTAAVTHADVGGSIPKLLAHIEPAVEAASENYPTLKDKNLVPAAITANVWNSIEELFTESEIIRELVQHGKLTVQGAIYHIEDGSVEWLGGHPDQAHFVPTDLTEMAGAAAGHNAASGNSHAAFGKGAADGKSGSMEAMVIYLLGEIELLKAQLAQERAEGN